jgi:hypothetical protein
MLACMHAKHEVRRAQEVKIFFGIVYIIHASRIYIIIRRDGELERVGTQFHA